MLEFRVSGFAGLGFRNCSVCLRSHVVSSWCLGLMVEVHVGVDGFFSKPFTGG